MEFAGDRLDVEAETFLGIEEDIWRAVLLGVWGDGRVELWVVGKPYVALFSHKAPKSIHWDKYAFWQLGIIFDVSIIHISFGIHDL